jgi:hypothetical protein
MGKLSDGIKRIKQAKADLKQAIKEKGVTVADTASLNEYDEAVKAIRVGNSIIKSRILSGRKNGIMHFEKGKDDRTIIHGLHDDSAYFDGTTYAETVEFTDIHKGNKTFLFSLLLWLDDKVKSDSPQTIFSYGVMTNRKSAPYNSITFVVKDSQNEPYLAFTFDKETYYRENIGTFTEPKYIFLPKKKWVHLGIRFVWDPVLFVNPSDAIDPKSEILIYINGECVGSFIIDDVSWLNIQKSIISIGKPYGTSLTQYINFNGNIKDVRLFTCDGMIEHWDIIPPIYNGEEIEVNPLYKTVSLPLKAGKDDDSLFTSKSFIYDTGKIENSSGFDKFGYPIRYRNTTEAGVAFDNGSSEDL